MYEINQQIMHFRDGLAVITGKTVMNDNEYFLIKAHRGSGEAIYVPVATADKIIRPIIDNKKADEVLLYIKNAGIESTPNTKQRRDSFKRKLSSGDPFDLGFLAKQLYLYENQQSLGILVKFGPADLEMLKYANDVLNDELSLAYNVDRSTIVEFINKRITKLK